MEAMVTSTFWANKKVFVTGHTGFKGSWLSLWLQYLGARVMGYALTPITQPNLFECAHVDSGMESLISDIRDEKKIKEILQRYQPEVVFHLAAQPLVRYSYQAPVETYTTNVIGTLNLLEAIRKSPSVKSVVIVTSDKCYDNKEWCWSYRETDAMGGYDPYSSSKGCVELLVASYRSSYFHPTTHTKLTTALASARTGNVIGGGDWSTDRLLPDIMKAFLNNETVCIRNPYAIRPWQHVLDPLWGYLLLAERLYTEGTPFAEAWNFGPDEYDAKPVSWIVNYLQTLLQGKLQYRYTEENHAPHEAMHLKLDSSKARTFLHWKPQWNLEQSLEQVVAWYDAFQTKQEMRQFTIHQIESYTRSYKKNK